MGKQGPCRHCGVTSTPLWRNGPPEKPILCNACGSRWRTKGTLVNYTPLHSRVESDEFEEYRVQRVKTVSTKNKEAKVLKRKQNHEVELVGRGVPDYNHGFQKGGGFVPDYNQSFRRGLDEDTSNRSSSGSAISNSESCMQLGSADASDLTGQAQSVVWDTMVPSRKRTCVSRPKPSSVEKLTKDLHTILHEQQSYFSGSSEEDLLFESDTPMVSVEIGHGSVLIRHPSSIPREEESEASSLSVDNKPHSVNEAYSRLTIHSFNKGVNVSCPGIERIKKPGQEIEQDQFKREEAQQEKLQILGNHNSPLCCIQLNDVVNFEEFERHLANGEQQQLLKYLSSVDTVKLPDSLKSMFDSPQFKEDLSAFQKLLAEGVFDLSSPEVKSEGNRTLKRLALGNLTKSSWVEQYNLLKDSKCKTSTGSPLVAGGHTAVATAQSVKMKRPRDGQFQNFPGAKTTMRSPKRVMLKTNYEHKELTENDATCFSPKSLFTLPSYSNNSLMLDTFQFADESGDQDLLLDVPSHSSFPQAELLMPSSSFGNQASTSSNSSIYQNHFRC